MTWGVGERGWGLDREPFWEFPPPRMLSSSESWVAAA